MSPAGDPLDALAHAALTHYALSPDVELALCNVSENHTYRVQDPAGGAGFALRVHRPGYRSAQDIESELAWLDALDRDGVVQTPGVVAATDGRRVVQASAPGAGTRHVVVFDWVPGIAPDLDSGAAAREQFQTLGAISARMHRHARVWPRPGTGGRGRRGWVWAHRSAVSWSASTRRSRRGWPPSVSTPPASGSCTPTSAWPTCSPTDRRCA
jgi:Ser/Thr protein kinase RdoA (MazF antagonist)